MADDSLTDGIASKLSDLAPSEESSSASNDTITLVRDGLDITVPRGSMSDEEWDSAVESARKKEGFKEASINGVRLTKSESSGAPSVKNPLSFVPSIMAGATSPDTETPPSPPTPVPLPKEVKPGNPRELALQDEIAANATGGGGTPGMLDQSTSETKVPLEGTGGNIAEGMHAVAQGYKGLQQNHPILAGAVNAFPPTGAFVNLAQVVDEDKQKVLAAQAEAEARYKAAAAKTAASLNSTPDTAGKGFTLPALPNAPGYAGIDPRLLKASEEANKVATNYANALGTKVEAENNALQRNYEQSVKLQNEELQRTQEISNLQTTHALNTKREIDDAIARSRGLSEQIAKESKVAIDPDRYWKKKDLAQGALSMVAGFCFGFSGRGGEYLKFLENAVEQDIGAQKFDKQSRMEGLKLQQAGIQDEINNHIKAGATVQEAYNLARQQRWETIGLMGRQLAEGTSNTQAQRAGNELAMQAKEKIAALAQTNLQHAENRANQKFQRDIELYKIQVENQQKIGALMSKNMGGRPMETGGAEKMAGAINAINEINNLKARYQKDASGTGSSVAQFVPGTSARAYEQQRRVSKQAIGYGLEGGKLAAGDDIKYEPMIPESSDSNSTAAAKLEALSHYAASKYKDNYDSFAAAGYDVSRFPSPEQYAAQVGASGPPPKDLLK